MIIGDKKFRNNEVYSIIKKEQNINIINIQKDEGTTTIMNMKNNTQIIKLTKIVKPNNQCIKIINIKKICNKT